MLTDFIRVLVVHGKLPLYVFALCGLVFGYANFTQYENSKQTYNLIEANKGQAEQIKQLATLMQVQQLQLVKVEQQYADDAERISRLENRVDQ